MQPGDVIWSIGGRRVNEYQEVIDSCYYLTAEEAVPFTVMLGLEDLTVSVVPSIRKENPLESGAELIKGVGEGSAE